MILYALSSCRSCTVFTVFSGTCNFRNKDQRMGSLTLGYALNLSSWVAPSLFKLGAVFLKTLCVSSSILMIIWVASAVERPFLKPDWVSHSTPTLSDQFLNLVAYILAITRLATGCKLTPCKCFCRLFFSFLNSGTIHPSFTISGHISAGSRSALVKQLNKHSFAELSYFLLQSF